MLLRLRERLLESIGTALHCGASILKRSEVDERRQHFPFWSSRRVLWIGNRVKYSFL